MNPIDTLSSSQTLALPRLSRSQAQARTQLVQRVREVEVSVAGSAWSLTLHPLQAELQPQQSGLLLVKAYWAGAAFCIVLPGNAAQAWIESRFPEADLPTLPHSYLALMLEAALADVCAGLAGLQRGAARIDSVAECTPAAFLAQAAACPHAFELQLANSQGTALVHLATDSLGLMLMAGLAARLPVAANSVPADALPVVVRAEAGFAWLTAPEFASLHTGDTVLLSHAFTDLAQRLWLSVDERWGLMVQCVQHPDGSSQFEVAQAFAQADLSYFSASMPLSMTPSDIPPTVASQTPSALDHIAFRLTFDLGERLMSLGEIKALQVGQPLALDRPLSQAVSMRVNGMLVGQGELVEIDGRLGVTVTALAGSPELPVAPSSTAAAAAAAAAAGMNPASFPSGLPDAAGQ